MRQMAAYAVLLVILASVCCTASSESLELSRDDFGKSVRSGVWLVKL